jgi:rhodanese-related sulfurtransferase
MVNTMIENLNPRQAWDLLQQNTDAVLVDVRTKVEHAFVGHPPGSIHIAWKEAPDWQVNSKFVSEVKKVVSDYNAPVLLLCRSGQRSMDAAKALEDAGFQRLINIIDGFEGPLDQQHHRGNLGGWRFNGLPWEQS